MGFIYSVKCDRCGCEFDQMSGEGFVCVGCGENHEAPFRCPCCGKKFNPQAPEFARQAYVSARLE